DADNSVVTCASPRSLRNDITTAADDNVSRISSLTCSAATNFFWVGEGACWAPYRSLADLDRKDGYRSTGCATTGDEAWSQINCP
ncbi:hypothetical protein PENTCL1PPCAC_5505, partial [Pristionchus entomophagus]